MVTTSTSVPAFDRLRYVRVADGLAVLLAAAIPWSTSAAGILAALYAIAVLPTLDVGSIRTVKATPAMWLPVALVALGVVGMLWADASWRESFRGLDSMAKLLVLPLVMLHFRQSDRAHWVVAGFFVSCTVLLAASLMPVAVPSLRWMWRQFYGVPVKDYIVQSGEFLICAFAALYLAVERFMEGRRGAAFGFTVLAGLFLASILYVTSGRTAWATLPVLLFGLRMFRWRGVAGAAVIGVILGVVAWVSSPYLRERTTHVVWEVERYRAEDAHTSSGYRLEFWKKSLQFIAEAPVLGHGTGSIESQFRKAAAATTGVSSTVTTNPHNQTLTIGVQLGLVGIAVLWAMWVAHVLLFRADGFLAWFGLLVTVETIVGSLFNSLLADFTQGWTYVVCVGAAGGAVLRATRLSAGEERSG
jgi:O-antigen ligase